VHGVIRHVIAEGQRQGTFRSDLVLEETAETVVNAMAKVWHPMMLDTYGVSNVETKTLALADLLLCALRASAEER
jgi:hypothetical protein